MRERIMGLESEYGSIVSMPNGSYRHPPFVEDEYSLLLAGLIEEATGSKITFLSNGMRVYSDIHHLECATPECLSAKELVLVSRACDLFVEKTIAPAWTSGELIFIRDNTDSKSTHLSFASHENYLVDFRAGFIMQGIAGPVMFQDWFYHPFLAYLASRIVFSGCGTVSLLQNLSMGSFLISPRAVLTNALSAATSANTNEFPFILTRTEHLSSNKAHFRLQLAYGDPLISQIAEFLRFGVTALVLRFAEEHGFEGARVGLENPVTAVAAWSQDTSCTLACRCLDGRSRTALEIQEIFFREIGRRYPADDDPPYLAEEIEEILRWWRYVLDGLRENPLALVDVLDWPLKKEAVDGYLREYFDLDGTEELARVLPTLDVERVGKIIRVLKGGPEQSYHELSERSLARGFERDGIQRVLFKRDEIARALERLPDASRPELRTRAFDRGRVIKWLKDHGVPFGSVVDWDKVEFNLNFVGPPGFLKSVILGDPFAWDTESVKSILAMP